VPARYGSVPTQHSSVATQSSFVPSCIALFFRADASSIQTALAERGSRRELDACQIMRARIKQGGSRCRRAGLVARPSVVARSAVVADEATSSRTTPRWRERCLVVVNPCCRGQGPCSAKETSRPLRQYHHSPNLVPTAVPLRCCCSIYCYYVLSEYYTMLFRTKWPPHLSASWGPMSAAQGAMLVLRDLHRGGNALRGATRGSQRVLTPGAVW
jgi:hypothetical protein